MLHRFGDLVTVGLRSVLHRDATDAAGPPVSPSTAVQQAALATEGAEQ